MPIDLSDRSSTLIVSLKQPTFLQHSIKPDFHAVKCSYLFLSKMYLLSDIYCSTKRVALGAYIKEKFNFKKQKNNSFFHTFF